MLRRQAERTEVFNLLCSELLTSFYLKKVGRELGSTGLVNGM